MIYSCIFAGSVALFLFGGAPSEFPDGIVPRIENGTARGVPLRQQAPAGCLRSIPSRGVDKQPAG